MHIEMCVVCLAKPTAHVIENLWLYFGDWKVSILASPYQHVHWGSVRKLVFWVTEILLLLHLLTLWTVSPSHRSLRPAWKTAAIVSTFSWHPKSLLREFLFVPFCPNTTPPLPSMTGFWASFRYVEAGWDGAATNEHLHLRFSYRLYKIIH